MNIRVKYGRVIPSPGSHMCGLTWDGHFLWHSDGSTNQLYCFDLSTNQLLRSLPCPEVRTGLSFRDGSLWQVVGQPKTLAVVSAEAGTRDVRVLDARFQGAEVCGIEWGPEGLWIGIKTDSEHSIAELRAPGTLSLVRRLEIPGEVAGLTCEGPNLLYTDFGRGRLTVVDSSSGSRIGECALEGHPTGLTNTGSSFWYCDYTGGVIREFALIGMA
jgi:hypothetical protein